MRTCPNRVKGLKCCLDGKSCSDWVLSVCGIRAQIYPCAGVINSGWTYVGKVQSSEQTTKEVEA